MTKVKLNKTLLSFTWSVFLLMFLKLFLFSSVLSPHSEKHGDVVSTSTDSGSVIIDMVGRIKTSERIGGRDTGLSVHCVPGLTGCPVLLLLLSLSQDRYRQVLFTRKRELCS